MTRYKLVLDRLACVGSFTCLNVDSGEEIWQMNAEEGKVSLKLQGEGLKKTSEQHEVIIEDEAMVKKVINSGQVCPVLAIKLFKQDTGENLIK